MNLKDRLENIKSVNVFSLKNAEETSLNFDVEQVFLDSDDVKSILIQAVNEGKNILFLSTPTMEPSLVSKYFKKLFYAEQKDIVLYKNIFDEPQYSENKINFILNPNMSEVVHILEKIMYGCGSCVFGITLKTLDYVLDKIKTAIALNYSNLTEENIEILLGTTDLLLVNFDKNSDGLYFVSKIDKVTFENYKTGMLTLFDSHPVVAKSKSKKTSKSVQSEKSEVTLEENNEKEVRAESETQISKTEQVQEQISEIVPEIKLDEENKRTKKYSKKNKYTMLKEKLRRKKVSAEE